MLTTLVALLLVLQTPSPASLWNQGATWPDYLQAARQQREAWLRNAERPVPDALVARLKAVAPGLRLLVVAEDWCSDSVNTIPYLASLATKAGVELRIVNSQIGKPVMDAHKTPDGRAATPTVVLLRGDAEVAAWVERPAVLQAWMLGPGAALQQVDRQQRKISWYEWNRGDDTAGDIVALAEKTAGAQRP